MGERRESFDPCDPFFIKHYVFSVPKTNDRMFEVYSITLCQRFMCHDSLTSKLISKIFCRRGSFFALIYGFIEPIFYLRVRLILLSRFSK